MIFAVMLSSLASDCLHKSLTHILYALLGFAMFLFLSFDFTMFPGCPMVYEKTVPEEIIATNDEFFYIDLIDCDFF